MMMMTYQEQDKQQQQDQMSSQIVNEKKEEKIAAARQKLKQFKKETKQNGVNGIIPHANDETRANNNLSGRSSPSSTYSSSSNKRTNNNHYQQQQQQQQSIPMQSTSFPLSINLLNESSLNATQFKEQLQLHVQTIGILVAEKAELQSKLQQQTKKSDKKQDECDELMGRLKASRQKITDLERLIQQLSEQNESDTNASIIQSQNQNEISKLIGEISSKDLLIDELRIRLDESNEKLNIKHQETQKLAQITLDLKSQLEIMQLKMSQLAYQQTDQTNLSSSVPQQQQQEQSQLVDEINKLKEENTNLNSKLEDANLKLDHQKEELKSEYQNYVDRLQRQIESLVDQINRMTDERENAFSKIDKLESNLVNSNEKNEKLNKQLEDLSIKLKEQQTQQQLKQQQQQPVNNNNEYQSKIDLLENEIKYFKQQIEILLHEQTSFKSIIEDKDQSITNLNKLLENYESDREKFNSLLEQTHNDKQTISRILKQNNELKIQFTELQDAYVNVTKANLELTTELQAEQFKLKKLETNQADNNENNKQKVSAINQTTSEQVVSSDWGDDNNDENSTRQELDTAVQSKNDTLMEGIRKRIEDLEKENKDLNDYISLMNTKENELIDSLKSKVKSLELEKSNLSLKLTSSNDIDHKQETSSSIELNNGYLNNMKLLEEKFNKVMNENADLKEKNQELEHVIQQLQFETETIIDYVTMYQVERSKLNEKYKQKDEVIRGLSTQLQVNKLALLEINNYLNAFIRNYQIDSEKPNSNEEKDQSERLDSNDENKQKRDYILIQIQNLLTNLTQTSSKTLSTIANDSTTSKSLPVLKQINSNSQNSVTNTQNTNVQTSIDEKSIAKFKTETVLCSSCYGDLFIV